MAGDTEGRERELPVRTQNRGSPEDRVVRQGGPGLGRGGGWLHAAPSPLGPRSPSSRLPAQTRRPSVVGPQRAGQHPSSPGRPPPHHHPGPAAGSAPPSPPSTVDSWHRIRGQLHVPHAGAGASGPGSWTVRPTGTASQQQGPEMHVSLQRRLVGKLRQELWTGSMAPLGCLRTRKPFFVADTGTVRLPSCRRQGSGKQRAPHASPWGTRQACSRLSRG